jgi:3-deoxy-manno-octulosonate cytidylyltransferase (CMP-KDO synthetase)
MLGFMERSKNCLVVIPARMESKRLPGKPLADICGAPMIEHVWRRAVEADIGPVVVAAGEKEISDAIISAGGDAVLTRSDHVSGSDRALEAVRTADPEGRFDIVVNLQGDLPTIEKDAVRAVLRPLENKDVDIATLVTEIVDEKERTDLNVVKAVLAFAGAGEADGEASNMCARALYFSRLPVPGGDGPLYHHIGIYAYRRSALTRFVSLPEGALERRERLEQLRALEWGMRIDAALVDTYPLGVDTPADLERARAILGS